MKNNQINKNATNYGNMSRNNLLILNIEKNWINENATNDGNMSKSNLLSLNIEKYLQVCQNVNELITYVEEISNCENNLFEENTVSNNNFYTIVTFQLNENEC